VTKKIRPDIGRFKDTLIHGKVKGAN
jgi:hypothetical protein